MDAGSIIVALSGPVCAGKTTLADGLRARLGARPISTREILRRRGAANARQRLQALGEALDRKEGGEWVARPVLQVWNDLGGRVMLVVDAVRTTEQISALSASAPVAHLHLTADRGTLRERYETRHAKDPVFEATSFESLCADPTEASVEDLAGAAELLLDTSALDIEATLAAAVRALTTDS